MNVSAPLYVLKRRAKAHAREHGLPLHAGLDHIAKAEGYRAWSHLAQAESITRPAPRVLSQLENGDCVLLGARPGQGKTLLGLELLVEAALKGRDAWFFSLECTLADVLVRLRQLGVEPSALHDRLHVDCSDAIYAVYVQSQVSRAAAGSVVVIDYLQILDQRRDHPALDVQLNNLSAFAQQRRLIVLTHAQIDRHYDAGVDTVPGLQHVRLPNPVNLQVFSKACFVQDGVVRFATRPKAFSNA